MTESTFISPRMNDKVIHHTTSHSLGKTQNGKIISSNIEDIYSVLLICLDLKELSPQSSSFFNLIFSNFPYSFTFQQAINTCPNLKVIVKKTNTIEASFTFNIKEKLAKKLMKIFITAKLLHSPVDRTKSVLDTPSNILQPTPKGVAILQMFIKKNGIPTNHYPLILKSNFNTLELYTFERSIKNDRIYTSVLGIELLFIKCMGKKPNVWSLNNCEDQIDNLYGDDISIDSHVCISNSKDIFGKDSNVSDDDFLNFQNFSFSDIQSDFNESFGDILCDQQFTTETPETAKKEKLSFLKKFKKQNKREHKQSQIKTHDGKIISPFGHRFFSNPESDAHIQYYVSNKGIRLFKDTVSKTKEIIEYCFSGKALAQWIMDCCEVFFPYEVALFGQQFIKLGLIEPIDNGYKALQFRSGRLNLYKLTPKGNSIVFWYKGETEILKATDEYKGMKSPVIEFDKLSFNILDGPNTSRSASNCSTKASLNNNSSSQTVSSKVKNRDDVTEDEVTLVNILNDAGLRHLFRAHLEDEYCAENFDCYNSLKFFKRDMKVLRSKLLAQNTKLNKMNDVKNKNKKLVKPKNLQVTAKIANDCLSNAYNIFGSYLVKNAPFEVNINYELKEDIADIMAHPVSPVMMSFKESVLGNPNRNNLRSGTETLLVAEEVIKNGDIYLNNVGASSFDDLYDASELTVKENINVFRKSMDDSYKKPELRSFEDDALPLYLLTRKSSKKPRKKDIRKISLEIPERKNEDISSEIKLLNSPTLIHNHLDILLVASKEFTKHDSMINETLFVLNRIYPYFEQVSKQLYYMMETDSLNKFYQSDIFRQAIHNKLI